MSFESIQEIISLAEEKKIAFWEAVLELDMENKEITREQSMDRMANVWHAMVSASQDYRKERISKSGLVGGDGAKMRGYAEEHKTIGGGYTAQVIAEALCMGENNACMRRIVAAPTAGACGVLPAVLIPLAQENEQQRNGPGQDNRRQENDLPENGFAEEKIIQALYVSSGIGAVIAQRACISGAAGGCQAEIGSASAMAAGALTALRDGTQEQIGHAVAMALKNLLGLVCDPVAGLVEVPCVKRNVVGAMNAISSADMALAGISSQIPADEVIDAMRDVGRRLPLEFRETALGGLAATKTGEAVKKKMFTNHFK